MSQPNLLSLTEAAAGLRNKNFSSRELVQSCLDRIEKREATVKAWVQIDAQAALDRADACDEQAAAGNWSGPLHGLPLGIKDIYDVEGFETAFGSDAWPAKTPTHDAASVARLIHAGAIILGKTVTTSFAMGDPGATCNPWNTAHTPGGSSSGSAAAVADRMCLAALGTQTAGSVIRPCAFNGLAGIKPGHSRIDIRGVLPLSWLLDHVGALTRSLEDADLLWQILRDDHDWRREADYDARLPLLAAEKPLRLWRMRGLFDDLASADTTAMMNEHCAALKDAGVDIVERELPDEFADVLDMHHIVIAAEAASSHNDGYANYSHKYPPRIKELVEIGQKISARDYILARRHRLKLINVLGHSMLDVDAAIMPAAAGAAPLGLEHTGDRSFNAPSSYIGFPVVCYANRVDSNKLPLGIQLLGRPDSEDELLKVGRWCEMLGGFSASPDAV